MSAKVALSLLVVLFAFANSSSILDYLDWEDGKKLIEVPELRNDQPNRNCMCKGPACVCCVDFNITFVDLGGPGCVHMKYLSPEDGFSVNVSYGKSLIHTAKIQGKNPAPICLKVFGRFAQVCAKFSELAPTADGLRGCLELEPKLLGEAQLDFPIGCFKSNAGGMEMEDPPEVAEETTEENTTEASSVFDAESFLVSIYHTAEETVEYFGSILGLSKDKLTTTTPVPPAEEASQRGAKYLKHPNQL